MEINIDFRSGIPIYIQIMEQIRHQIAGGVMHPGDQLPTVRQMATDLRVNFNTIARAYRLLDEAGIISTQHGRGTYILAETSIEDATLLRQQALEDLTQRYLGAAARLGFAPQEVERLFTISLERWKVQGSSPGKETKEYD